MNKIIRFFIRLKKRIAYSKREITISTVNIERIFGNAKKELARTMIARVRRGGDVIVDDPIAFDRRYKKPTVYSVKPKIRKGVLDKKTRVC